MSTDPVGAREPSEVSDLRLQRVDNRLVSRDDPCTQVDPPTAPWTVVGGVDPAYDAATRERNRAWLTDPRLAERFQQLHPGSEPVYERMIRALDLVWDCPDDDSVNVAGYRCAGCGASRETALLAARCREVP